MLLRAAIILVVFSSVKYAAAQPLEGWWIVLATYPYHPNNPAYDMSNDVRSVIRQADGCGIKFFNDLSGKFFGFSPGRIVFVKLGSPYQDKIIAEKELKIVRSCFGDAYIKRGRYAGE